MRQSKASIALNTKFCSIHGRLAGISMSNFDPSPNSTPPVGEVRVDLGVKGVENGTNLNLDSPFLSGFYMLIV